MLVQQHPRQEPGHPGLELQCHLSSTPSCIPPSWLRQKFVLILKRTLLDATVGGVKENKKNFWRIVCFHWTVYFELFHWRFVLFFEKCHGLTGSSVLLASGSATVRLRCFHVVQRPKQFSPITAQPDARQAEALGRKHSQLGPHTYQSSGCRWLHKVTMFKLGSFKGWDKARGWLFTKELLHNERRREVVSAARRERWAPSQSFDSTAAGTLVRASLWHSGTLEVDVCFQHLSNAIATISQVVGSNQWVVITAHFTTWCRGNNIDDNHNDTWPKRLPLILFAPLALITVGEFSKSAQTDRGHGSGMRATSIQAICGLALPSNGSNWIRARVTLWGASALPSPCTQTTWAPSHLFDIIFSCFLQVYLPRNGR